MTVIFGFKQNNFVTIIGDTKRSNMTQNQEILSQGTFDTVKKVFPIGENLIGGVMGIGELGDAVISLLNSVFSMKHNLTVEEIMMYIKKTCVFAHRMFLEVNPGKYAELGLTVAGIDVSLNKSYLYEFRSDKNFEPINRVESSFLGPGYNEFSNFINKGHSLNNYQDGLKLFSAAIREINHELVSKDTYSISIFQSSEGNLKHFINSVDSKGNMKALDLKGNEIKF